MKRFLIFFLVVCSLSGATFALASHNGLPSVGWTSGQQIQNIGSANATIFLKGINSLGYAYTCKEHILAFGESHNYLTDDDKEECYSDDFTDPNDLLLMPAGFNGSGVVYSDQPVAGIININNKGFGRAAGLYNATSEAVDTNISFPLAKNDHGSPGRTTTFYIQNASDSTNTITATFKMNGSSTSFTTSFPNVAPYARVILQPGDIVTPASLTIGALIITGTQNLAGIAIEHPTHEPMVNSMQVSRAFVEDDHGTTLHCPLLRRGWGSAETTTGLQVQNVGDQETSITVTYTEVQGDVTTEVVTENNISIGESVNFLQANHFDPQTLASAVISSSPAVDLVAIVNDRANGTNPKRYFHYACFSDDNASTTISLPLVKEHFFGNTSGIQIQNTGTISTHLVLTYTTGQVKDSNIGNITYVITTTVPVGPGASKTFWNLTGSGTNDIVIFPTDTSSLARSNSGVIVRSLPWDQNAAQPIVAIVVESTESSSNPQDSKGYEGINLD